MPVFRLMAGTIERGNNMKLNRWAGAGLRAACGPVAAHCRNIRAMFLGALICIGTLSAIAEAGPDKGPRPMVVSNDPGGNVKDRIQRIEHLRRSGQRVEIRQGYCLSACTLYLGMQGTCVGPTARFGFHGPSSPIYGIALARDDFEYWSRVMASYYPEPLRRWYLQTGRTISVGFYEMSGRELIRLGVRQCT